MRKIRKGVATAGAVTALAVGILAAAPGSAMAGPTNETFSTKAACEKRAAQIRDGIVGAECKAEWVSWTTFRWRLYVYN